MVLFLFLLQMTTTLFMTGLIWFVQIVHYPLFAKVGADCLSRYETVHAQRTTWVVFPPMLVELLSAAAWLYPPMRPLFIPEAAAWVLAALVGTIWLTTALGHVPLHTRLGQSPDCVDTGGTLKLLVRLNWVRTLAWTARSLLLVAALWRGLRG